MPVLFKDTVSVPLTQDDWIEVLGVNTTRVYVDIQNEAATFDARFQHIRNPFMLSLDGAGDFVEIDAILGGSSPIIGSKSGFINIRLRRDSGGAGEDVVFSLGDTNANEYLKLFIDASNKVVAELRTAAAVQWKITADTAIPTGEFLRVELRHDEKTPSIRINGGDVDVTFNTSTDITKWVDDIDANVDNARLGCLNVNSAGNADFFLGDIDEVKIVANIKPSDLRGAEDVALYRLGDGTLTAQSATATDSSVNAFTGNVNGATWEVRNTGRVLGADTGREFTEDEASTQALWAFTTDLAHSLGITEGIRENGFVLT